MGLQINMRKASTSSVVIALVLSGPWLSVNGFVLPSTFHSAEKSLSFVSDLVPRTRDVSLFKKKKDVSEGGNKAKGQSLQEFVAPDTKQLIPNKKGEIEQPVFASSFQETDSSKKVLTELPKLTTDKGEIEKPVFADSFQENPLSKKVLTEVQKLTTTKGEIERPTFAEPLYGSFAPEPTTTNDADAPIITTPKLSSTKGEIEKPEFASSFGAGDVSDDSKEETSTKQEKVVNIVMPLTTRKGEIEKPEFASSFGAGDAPDVAKEEKSNKQEKVNIVKPLTTTKGEIERPQMADSFRNDKAQPVVPEVNKPKATKGEIEKPEFASSYYVSKEDKSSKKEEVEKTKPAVAQSPATSNKSSKKGEIEEAPMAKSFQKSVAQAYTKTEPKDTSKETPKVEATKKEVKIEASKKETKVEKKEVAKAKEIVLDEEDEEEVELTEAELFDNEMMTTAIDIAKPSVGEKYNGAPYPRPVAGAVLVGGDGKRILGKGFNTCTKDCISECLRDAGLKVITPLHKEWFVTWPEDPKLRREIATSTIYLTLEPAAERRGESLPPMTQLLINAGIARVVIGSPDPVPGRATHGAAALHAAGVKVSMGVMQEECDELIADYTYLANTKLQRFARRHLKQFGRPLGFLHCSVIDSNDKQAFARNGNAFGKNLNGQMLSSRNFGAYELAPPPESIWSSSTMIEGDNDVEFDDELEEENLRRSPMMQWYQEVDAVVTTFPRAGNNGINEEDQSIRARLKGLKWLATHGRELPSGVERILVLDSTELVDLPLTNDDPNLPLGVDVEEFWKGEGRKPTRLLLRHSTSAQAKAAARAAAEAAQAASEAAERAKQAIETGDAEMAAEVAIKCNQAAIAAMNSIQSEVEALGTFKRKLTDLGVIVEAMSGGEPIDVMNHLGKRHGYKAVVWRAGCWGERGVQSILRGAFQWVSAHLAVDAKGGKFWQLMLAERAVQAACGPQSKVNVFAEQEDFSLEYCDSERADKDCVLMLNGRPIRHIRLDVRVVLLDENRPREFKEIKTKPMRKGFNKVEEGPWFL